jgi:hypothetical protein
MGFRLTSGIIEAPRERRFTYPAELLTLTGPYGSGLIGLGAAMAKWCPETGFPPAVHHKLRLFLVHECEQAKAWLALVRRKGEDYEAARRAQLTEERRWPRRATRALDELLNCDEHAAFLIRSAFSAGLGSAVPPCADVDYVLPNQNRDDGGLRVKLSGDVRQAVELQFASRAALGDLDQVLRNARSRLEDYGTGATSDWHQIGNLRLSPPLSHKAKSGIAKQGDRSLGIAILGLAAGLSAWFREWSAKGVNRVRWVGEPLPSYGQPCWSLVAEFVNDAFSPCDPETGESLRQRVHTVFRRREVRIVEWPQAAVRQPQVQKD